MNLPPTTRLRLVDRLSREWYVLKVEFLAQDVPCLLYTSDAADE